MSIHYKVNGEWVTVDRPYYKTGGVWTPMTGVYRKDAGVWKESYVFDNTPPAPPVLALELVDTTYWENGNQKSGRHLRVGAKSAGGAHDPKLKRIRVLSTYNGASPTTQYGGTYTTGADETYPDEPWSDRQFNGFNGSDPTRDSSVMRYKQWPRNANASTNMAEGRYYFAAWAEDLNGNWSNGVFNSIVVPKKGVDGANTISKEARFQVTNTGSWSKGAFTSGVATQSGNPVSTGYFFYNGQLQNQIGKDGAPTIKSAQIFLHRKNDDGRANANVYLFWHNYGGPSAIPGTGPDKHEVTLIGQIAKGESKWFDIPAAYWPNLNKDIKGFGLNYKDPVKAAAADNDYSVMKSMADAVRTAEVHVVWTEKP